MAVDIEPTVFWNGRDPAFDVSAWKRDVGFVEGDAWPAWGHIGDRTTNGPSGADVETSVLAPLGLDAARVCFTDAVRSYFVKYRWGDGLGSGEVVERVEDRRKGRDQGDAIRDDYAPFVAALRAGGAHAPPDAVLERRPSEAGLVARALAGEATLLRLLAECDAPLLITLGEEARRVAAGLSGSRAEGAPSRRLEADDAGYGDEGALTIGDRVLRWRALVHPGQKSARWKSARDAWQNRVLAGLKVGA